MSTNPCLIDDITVASPCSASWDAMPGDDRVRFCSQCSLKVYNLSAMTQSEAEALIEENEGRLCGRFYRRSDGTVLTKDCPIGALAWTHAKVTAALAVLVSLVVGVAAWFQADAKKSSLKPRMAMGAICMPANPPSQGK